VGSAPGFRTAAGALFLVALGLRVAYVVHQPSSDPSFLNPALDARTYLEWARSLAAGAPGPEGAFYLAPLYAYLLAGFFRVFGENLVVACGLQQLSTLAAAGLLGLVAARAGGRWAGLATASLLLFHHPLLFFGGRLVGESVALLLLSAAIFFAGKDRTIDSVGSGILAGASALARPNLILVPLVWSVCEAAQGRFRRAGAVLAGALLVVLPVTVRNLVVSGHPVLISSNGGLTLYHGNGPGPLGVYNPPDGFSGDLAHQREEATELASHRTGKVLDPVEADLWWGREAVRSRLQNPSETLRLAFRRVLLVVDSYEHGLDDPPMLDRNPLRLTGRLGFPRSPSGLAEIPLVPFGLLVGLAVAGLLLRGFSGTGGVTLWGALAACAATPLVFYVSSRYRLPVSLLLAVPAGAGVSRLLSSTVGAQARFRAVAAGSACVALSFLVPFPELRRAEEAAALANRAVAFRQVGDLTGAERAARRAVEVDPESTPARFTLGLLLERSGRRAEAEREYREVLRLDPGHAESAGNLAGLLVVSGRPAEAVPALRAALRVRPRHRACWTNLVVALAASGDEAGTRTAAEEAIRSGVILDEDLLRRIGVRKDPGATGR